MLFMLFVEIADSELELSTQKSRMSSKKVQTNDRRILLVLLLVKLSRNLGQRNLILALGIAANGVEEQNITTGLRNVLHMIRNAFQTNL